MKKKKLKAAPARVVFVNGCYGCTHPTDGNINACDTCIHTPFKEPKANFTNNNNKKK